MEPAADPSTKSVIPELPPRVLEIDREPCHDDPRPADVAASAGTTSSACAMSDVRLLLVRRKAPTEKVGNGLVKPRCGEWT